MQRVPSQLAAPPGGTESRAGRAALQVVSLVWVLLYLEEISETEF